MFQDATEAADSRECGLETAVIVATLVAPSVFDKASKLTPSGAWWMRHDRHRTRVEPGVSGLVPRINVRQIRVGAVAHDVEGGDACHSLGRSRFRT